MERYCIRVRILLTYLLKTLLLKDYHGAGGQKGICRFDGQRKFDFGAYTRSDQIALTRDMESVTTPFLGLRKGVGKKLEPSPAVNSKCWQ